MIRKWIKRSLLLVYACGFMTACGLSHGTILKTLVLIGMASGINQTHANAIITADFQGTSVYASPATMWLAVYTVDPSDTAAGTEVTTVSTGYARISFTCNATNFTPVSAGTVLLATVATYAIATANYGICTAVSTMSAVTAGNLYYWGDMNANVTINNGNQLSFPANSITFAYV
jgi:hypothetical protein